MAGREVERAAELPVSVNDPLRTPDHLPLYTSFGEGYEDQLLATYLSLPWLNPNPQTLNPKP